MTHRYPPRPESAARLHATMRSGGAEERIYRDLVATGILRIDDCGRIWREVRRDGKLYLGRTRAERPHRRAGRVHWAIHHNLRRRGLGVFTTTPQRLVWLHFFGPIPRGAVVLSTDPRGVSQDPGDLRFVPGSQANLARARQRERVNPGRRPRGERNHASKLTDQQVRELRIERSRGAMLRELVITYGISLAAVGQIVAGKSRADAGGPFTRGAVGRRNFTTAPGTAPAPGREAARGASRSGGTGVPPVMELTP